MEEQRETLYQLLNEGASQEEIVIQSQRLDDCITDYLKNQLKNK